MLRIGIIGAGEFAKAHAQAIASMPEVKLVAASRRNTSALASFCQQFDCQAYSDYRDLLRDDGIDAVVICTPHHVHAEQALASAKAGKHILLEKPMALSLADCDAIIKASNDHGVKLMLNHVSHFVPAYVKAKALLMTGEFGAIVSARSTMTRPWMTANRQAWHLSPETGGGMWLTIGVHVLDQLCWLVDAPVRSITADLQTGFHTQEADDTGVALLRFANGASASASCIGYKSGVFSFLTELYCQHGMLRIDHQEGLFIGQDEHWQAVANSTSEDWMDLALSQVWHGFVDGIVHDAPMPVTGDFARDVMAVAFAAEHSSRYKEEVRLL